MSRAELPVDVGGVIHDIPAPSPVLMEAVKELRPVKTRQPWRSLALVSLVMALWPASLVAKFGVRRDWSFLPRAFTVGFALSWAVALFVILYATLVPPKQQVLPNTQRAGRLAFAAALLLTLASWIIPGVADGHTLLSPADAMGFWRQWWHCTFFSLQISASVFLVGAFVVRKIAPVGRPWLGAGLGGAGGALAGLLLHLLCPVGDGPHVALSHGGGMVLGLGLGAALLPLALRARRSVRS